jgi:capsular polysaccharide biosynthesis protein
MNLIMGAITGLTLGISLAFFIEYMDRSIKGIEDVEMLLELPVLGVIPRFSRE